MTVFKKNIDIEGQAESRSNIKKLSIQAENWKLETGNWKLETGDWKLETGNRKPGNDQVSSLKFQVSFNQSVSLGLGKNRK